MKRIADNLSLPPSLSHSGGSQSHSPMFLSNTAHIKARGFKSCCSKHIGWLMMTLEKQTYTFGLEIPRMVSVRLNCNHFCYFGRKKATINVIHAVFM